MSHHICFLLLAPIIPQLNRPVTQMMNNYFQRRQRFVMTIQTHLCLQNCAPSRCSTSTLPPSASPNPHTQLPPLEISKISAEHPSVPILIAPQVNTHLEQPPSRHRVSPYFWPFQVLDILNSVNRLYICYLHKPCTKSHPRMHTHCTHLWDAWWRHCGLYYKTRQYNV